ncbi:inner membrane protein translocase component YidC [Candidatus Protochlamydia naegleriophila]|uniref:Membrane protein insertase YidC n=1 Tax=Candidatus Protochlamydia naegleriophila TaxID=389348 RepID=A0A0U5J8M6_9BACT|nr:membrane protein insertase YidC [Candidatus Protochlamydia naegleriophila]CUI16425.1 inner membrane protein translocase component YidC [Candidatus Protochlamydia naegleriophila]
MDRRTILFVIALSLTLFGMNIFFQNQNTQQKQEWLAQQQAKQVLKSKKQAEDIRQRTATLDSLPLAAVYADASQQQRLTSGLLKQDLLLTLAWAEEAPSHIFVSTPQSDQAEEYTLVYQEPGVRAPVLYRLKGSSANLPVGSLPDFGRYELQLVAFNDADFSTQVALGEYIDGHLAILNPEVLHLENGSSGYAALALLKTPQGYLPVGLYDANDKALVRLSAINELAPFLAIAKQQTSQAAGQKGEEKFYVLENAYQQLVFSNRGAALAEVNLPFKTNEDHVSVVREIEFDRDMVKNHPYNAHFPAHSYYTPAESDGKEFTFHEQGFLGGYYPLLRRDLIQAAPRKSVQVKPQYYALNIVSDYPELAELPYEVTHFDEKSITFEAVQNHRRITKTYSFGDSAQESPYTLNLAIQIDGDSRGLWLTSGIPEVEWISGGAAPSLKYRITRNQKSEVEKIDLPKDSATVTSIYPDWICNSNGFLGMIVDPLKEIDAGFRVQTISGLTVPSRLTEIDQEYDMYKAADLPGYMVYLPLKSQGGSMNFRFFAGPFEGDILKEVDAKYSNAETGYNPDYVACQTMHGWFTFISEPFAKFLLVLMKFFHYLTGSWGLSIILLTVSLRLMLYPLNTWSTKSMVRMQQISPEVAALQEKYKKDPKKAQIEIMSLYKERGVNPASGCLPLLIQMPFLIGMFDLLKSSFALRGAPFIPGWIDDLTAPDVLFSWSKPIFFIGTEFHLLPILLGLVMFIQQRFMATGPKDPDLMTDQQRQQRAMGTMMTVVFAVMFYNFPSGLNIYWLSSMLLGILQQWYITKKLKKEPTTAPKPAPKKGRSR